MKKLIFIFFFKLKLNINLMQMVLIAMLLAAAVANPVAEDSFPEELEEMTELPIIIGPPIPILKSTSDTNAETGKYSYRSVTLIIISDIDIIFDNLTNLKLKTKMLTIFSH